MGRYEETKRVLKFMKSPDNMPKTGAKPIKEEEITDPELIMEEILAEEKEGPVTKKKKKKKKKSDDEFIPGQESTSILGDY